MNLLWKVLNWTFSNKFVDCNDRYSLIFDAPASFGSQVQIVTIVLPSVSFSLQVIWIVFLQMILGCILATVIFYWILPDNAATETTESSKTSVGIWTSASGFLIGFGVVIPITLLIPFYVIDTFDIRNLGFRLAWVSLPMTMILRTLEAMFGFVPLQHRLSLWSYVRHVGFVLQPKYDTDGTTPVTATFSSMIQILQDYFFWLIYFAISYHFLSPYGFAPFTNGDLDVNPTRVFYWDWPHLYDTFLQAAMINITLSLSMTGVSSMASLLTGVQMNDQVTHHPMFLSESVSDFWGRRWNNLIHVALKQGVYKPVISATSSKSLASISAFLVSGLCHEYVWTLLYIPTTAQLEEGQDSSECCPSCYCQSWTGKQLVFFGWNGCLIALEYLCGDYLARYTRWLPRLLRSHLVVLLALPVGHLFTTDITMAGYFSHLCPAIPTITYLMDET